LPHGLRQASFVPPQPLRELEDLYRMQASLMPACVQTGNRLWKVLEDANSKLHSVASHTLGVSGRDMVGTLIGGKRIRQP
jgi:hypothetical protein